MRIPGTSTLRWILSSRGRHLLVPAMTVAFFAFVSGVLIKREGLAYHLGAWRAQSLLRDSQWAAERRDWKEAVRAASAAWQLHPGTLPLLRQLHHSLEGAGAPEALATAAALFEHPAAEARDRFTAIRLHLHRGDPHTTSSLLSRLPAEERDTPEALELGARFLLARNQAAAALPLVDRLRRRRNDPGDLLLAAEILAETPSEAQVARDEAQRIAGELFLGSATEALAVPAFLLLQRIPPRERQLYYFGDARRRLETLAARREVPVRAWLLADELDLATHPEQREAILHGAIERWIESEPRTLGEWLVARGESALFLKNTRRSQAYDDPAMLPLVVQAFALEGRWDRALGLLERAPRSTDPVTVFSLRAMVQERLGRAAEANQNWNRAVRYAELEIGRDSLLRLGRLAELGGKPEIRDLAMVEALKRPADQSLAAADVAGLFPALVRRERDEDLLSVSLDLLRTQPGNPQILNNAVWLEALRGATDPARMEQLAGFVERFPTIVPLRTTLALAQLRAGRRDQALGTLGPVAAELEGEGSAPDSGRAVYALALAENGDPERARRIAASIDWTRLIRAERDFFAAALDPGEDEGFLLDEAEGADR